MTSSSGPAGEERPAWARPADGGWLLELRVQPGARRSAVVGPLGEALKVKVAAPADDGKANAELIRFLADALGVPRRSVRIVRGSTSRTKTVAVEVPVPCAALVAALVVG